MKHVIMTDLEGPAGIERFSQTYGGEPFKLPAMRLLTEEVNACVQGIFDADPMADIAVIDGHGAVGIVPAEMDPRAEYVRGREAYASLLDQLHEFDTFMYVGQHAMAGMPYAPLCHTGSSKAIVYKRFNGVFVGEFGQGVLMAGHANVPMIFLSGDDKAVYEAMSLVPNIYTVITKWGTGWQKARHLAPEEARKQIRETAALAVQNRGEFEPVKVEPPYTWEIRYIHPTKFPMREIEGVSQTVLDSRTVLYRFEDLGLLRLL